MARKIQVRRGTAANMPTLADGEPGLQTDTAKLYVGNSGANLPVAMGEELNVTKTALNAAIAGKAAANHAHTADHVGARPNTWTPSKWDVGLGNADNTADSQKSVNYANTSGNTNAVGGRAAGTVLSEIDNLKTSVANGKAQIASAISDKGVSTGAGADFGTMANNIRAIQTGPNYVDITVSVTTGDKHTQTEYVYIGQYAYLGVPVGFQILGLYASKKITEDYTGVSYNALAVKWAADEYSSGDNKFVALLFYFRRPQESITARAVVRVFFASGHTAAGKFDHECETYPMQFEIG